MKSKRRPAAAPPAYALATLDPAVTAAATIRLGQESWAIEKQEAVASRERWVRIGHALLKLKDKANRPGPKFSEAVKRDFPGLGRTAAQDAMWWAGIYQSLVKTPEGISHPTNIRMWHSHTDDGPDLDALLESEEATKAFAAQVLAAEAINKAMQGEAPPELAVRLDPRQAEREAKVIQRRNYGGQGSDTAKRRPTNLKQDMNDDNEQGLHSTVPQTLTLRPIPGVPWAIQHPAFDATELDLRGLLPDGAIVTRIALNGRTLKHRVSGDHPHHLGIPFIRLEGDYLDIYLRPLGRPLDGPLRPYHGSVKGKVAGQMIEAPAGPDLRSGLLPAGARV